MQESYYSTQQQKIGKYLTDSLEILLIEGHSPQGKDLFLLFRNKTIFILIVFKKAKVWSRNFRKRSGVYWTKSNDTICIQVIKKAYLQ